MVLNYIEPIFLVGKNIEGLTESDEYVVKHRYVRNHQPPLRGGYTIIRRRRKQIHYFFAMKERIRHACPGKNGSKCVEVTPPMIFNDICSGCVRNAIRVSPAILQQREHAKNTKDLIVELKKLA